MERELKLSVLPDFRLPDLNGVVDAVTARPRAEQCLDATYYDTPDLRMARSGATLRHRSGEGWTLKLAHGDEPGEALSRRELTVAGDSGTIPAELSRLVVAWVRTSALAPVARLQTTRHGAELMDHGAVAAEVVHDEVSVLHGPRPALRFGEVEVELRPAARSMLVDAVVARLQAAGACAGDRIPKVVRALGPRALDDPELASVETAEQGSAGAAVAAALAASLRRLLASDAGVRLGEDPEEVHRARVATRRLRCNLRTFAPLLDEHWAEELRAELKWVAGALGRVRDADVLLERLEAGADELALADRGAAREIVERLRGQRVRAAERLSEVLEDQRYAVLLDRLVLALDQPGLGGIPAVPAGAPVPVVPRRRWMLAEGEAPATAVLPALVRRPWKRLRRAVADVQPDGPDDQLHRVRIRAKRCRYAAEVAAVAVGKPARRLASAVADLQDVLGEHQDAVVAGAWLRSVAPELTPAEALVAGQLVAAQRSAADATRQAWLPVWDRANRPKLRAWMS